MSGNSTIEEIITLNQTDIPAQLYGALVGLISTHWAIQFEAKCGPITTYFPGGSPLLTPRKLQFVCEERSVGKSYTLLSLKVEPEKGGPQDDVILGLEFVVRSWEQ